jgi:hypothetical protein
VVCYKTPAVGKGAEMPEAKTEETQPINCAECGAPAQVLYSEKRREMYDTICTDPECHRDVDCKRTTRIVSVRFWNKTQRAKLAGTYRPKINVTAKRDNPDNVPRCRCSLALPCDDCIKPLEFYANARHGYDIPVRVGRLQ